MELRLLGGSREVGARAGGLDLRLGGGMAALGGDLRADIIAAKVDIIKCWVGLIAVQTLVILGAFIALVRP
jgi:hypothetical protein